MLVESLSDRFWQELVLSVDLAARRRDVHLYVFVGGTLDAPELAARQANRCYLLAGPENIDGLLVASLGTSAGPERLAQYFERYRPLPMCALTALFESEGSDFKRFYAAAGRLAALPRAEREATLRALAPANTASSSDHRNP